MLTRNNRLWLAPLALLLAAACGSRPSPNRNNGGPGLAACGDTCVVTADCAEGQCSGGVCDCSSGNQNGSPCTDSCDCGANEYCHYASVSPWVPGTAGTCAAPCSGQCDLSNGFFQTCHEGICYTEIDCTPSGAATQCPPGEVCNSQSHTCTAPPRTCYFNEQCPTGWVCNTDNTCIDPECVNLGGCTNASDCETVASCANSSCECNAGSCQPRAGCTDASQCGTGNYCAAGVCRPAVSCASGEQGPCTPYGLVCENGYCVNADPCNNGVCPAEQTCNTTTNPPQCFPTGTNDCVRDETCAAGQYCELFNGTCQSGCRNDADCATGERCSSAHACTTGGTGNPGDSCSSNNDCPGGTVCAYNDPTAALTCDVMPVGDCSKSCRVVCDLLVSAVADTCPAGTKCGGNSDAMTTVIMQLMQSMMGGSSSSASACY